jgi:putative component of membrane protein insertase Oxa1/YidC/SpoIIIJ protein YidD
VLAGWRLLRCNPFSHGGLDPVSAQRLFRDGRAGAQRGESYADDPCQRH